MELNKMLDYLKNVLENMPSDWLKLTTHRLDIYNEELAKVQFLDQFKVLAKEHNSSAAALENLPTAYDYIRLGHPLSCILEWAIGNMNHLESEQVISFQSETMPILSILRTNLFKHSNTLIAYTGEFPSVLDVEVLRAVYGYTFEIKQVDSASTLEAFDGSVIFVSEQDEIAAVDFNPNIDFYINLHGDLGSLLLVSGEQNTSYISDIHRCHDSRKLSGSFTIFDSSNYKQY